MPSFDVIVQGFTFQEAIDYFRQKINLPTATWTDIWQEAHARSFVVAGAMRDDMLADFRDAIDRAIAEGTTLQQFRKDFDRIVEKYGWDYRGGRGWRTNIIFNTNLRVNYQVGHYRQMMDADVVAARPYWRYVAVMDGRTRPLHAAWHNTVLPFDDPWWRTHYPPNGWNCRCTVVNHSGRELERMQSQGIKLVEKAPPMEWEDHVIKMSDGSQKTITVPRGIDPGWAYNVGAEGFRDAA